MNIYFDWLETKIINEFSSITLVGTFGIIGYLIKLCLVHDKKHISLKINKISNNKLV